MNRRFKWKGVLLTAFSLFLLIHGNRGLWKMAKLQQEKAILSRQVERLNADVSRYQNELQTFGSNIPAIEKLAREELNLVRPGEVIYLFSPVDR